MRVTKLIREYVEKTVKAMPKFKNPTPEELAYAELQQKISRFVDSVEDEMKVALQEAIDNFRAANGIGADVEIRPYDYNIIRYNTFNSDLACKANAAKQKRAKAGQDAINDILVNLELGADRKELDEMLKKLGAD